MSHNKSKKLDVVYSPLCEANGAFLGELKSWFQDTEVLIHEIPFNELTPIESEWYHKTDGFHQNSNRIRSCFIDVFYDGKLIDTVPIKREEIESALDLCSNDNRSTLNHDTKILSYDLTGSKQTSISIQIGNSQETKVITQSHSISVAQFKEIIRHEEIKYTPITQSTYQEEMSMCLNNYPYGNPPEKYQRQCRKLKEKVFSEVWSLEDIAGIYAVYQNKVIGLLEVLPREIVKKYGFMTGTMGKDEDYITVGCYEIGFGIPRVQMIDELMYHLEMYSSQLHRSHLEGIGVLEWNDGFTPYWVYDKYGFKQSEIISNHTFVMEKSINDNH